MEKLFDVIHEDDELLVINKQAGLVCHPTKGDACSSLIGRVRLHVGNGHEAHLINRLDRETSGIVLVAKNTQAALELRRGWELGSVRKQYLAIVHGHPIEASGLIDAPLGKDDGSFVAIKDCVREDGSPARTRFIVLCKLIRTEGDFALLLVQPATGRKHQIRIHLSHHGYPIVGDKLYGANDNLYLAFVAGRLTEAQRAELIFPCHALHAWKLSCRWRDGTVNFCAHPEPWFSDFVGEGIVGHISQVNP